MEEILSAIARHPWAFIGLVIGTTMVISALRNK